MLDRTYIINLARRTDNRSHMKNELKKLKNVQKTKINHQFYMAVDGNDKNELAKYSFKTANWFDPKSGKAMTGGEVGCALSHYFIWKDIVDSVENGSLPEGGHVLILEDDVVFLDNFMEKIKLHLENVPKDCDMLYIHRKPINPESEEKLNDFITTVNYSYWTCGYFVTYQGAKKLISTKYLEHLIPVDEYLPIMYGCKIHGFEKLYGEFEPIKCYACTKSLLKLKPDAFERSDTFHSDSVLGNKFIFDDGKEFLVIYFGKNNGDSYQRFCSYCEIYGLPYKWVNSDPTTQSLKNELGSWDESKLKSTFIIVFSSEYGCNILPIASPPEILDKYKKLAKENREIIIPAKNSNPYGFCGWANEINDILEEINFDKLVLLGLLNSLLKNDRIVTDNNCEIFHILDNDYKININYKSQRVNNTTCGTYPSIILTNNDHKLTMNRIQNYTGNGWNEYYGFRLENNKENCKSKVYMSLYLKNNAKVKKIVDHINYPSDRLTIRLNRVGAMMRKDVETLYTTYNNEEKLYQEDLKEFLKTDCEYYFFIGNSFVITNPEILNDLLQLNKKVVAPLVKKSNESWSNFWGDLDDNGYYKRSFDYFDIINYEKKGCWNVPYISGVYLVKRDVIEAHPDLFSSNTQMDIDMRLCYNLRRNDVNMYVSNMEEYGYIEESSPLTEAQIRTELTIFDLFTRRDEWEKKYLHPEYYKCKNSLDKLRCNEVCTDIYNYPLFSETFCKEMIDTMEALGEWSKGNDEHNDPRLGKDYIENVPTSDVQLFQIGFDKQWEDIVSKYVAPMTKMLYNNYKTKGVHLAFVVKYSLEGQKQLQPHHDASNYSINIALNRGNGVDYDGGGTRFIRRNFSMTNQEIGTALVHAGRLTAYHEGLPITAGTRYILVSFIN